MTYDVAVVGGGPGGYVAAIRCARLGLKTVLIEKDAVGGTCLNRGCIPTKSLLHSAKVYQTVKDAAAFGVYASDAGFDYAKIASIKDGIVAGLRGGVEYLLKEAGIKTVAGQGKCLDAHTLLVDKAGTVSAENMILATGSETAPLSFPGHDLSGVLDSDGALALTEFPKSAVIIGGGVSGIEFAAVFRTFGAEVTVIEKADSILPAIDAEVSQTMLGIMRRQGVNIYTKAGVKGIEKNGGLTCHYAKDGKELSASGDICIIAAGRKPNTHTLGLEAIGVKTDGRGYITTDDKMRTNIKNIYAVGDITGGAQLAHAASAQGIVAAHNCAGEERCMLSFAIPSCVYTDPEIACVGLTERQAAEKGLDVRVGHFSVAANGKCRIMNERDGFVKLIAKRDTGEILGAHMISPGASDMIAEICAVMRSEGTIEELADTIHPHPTVSEIVMEAAEDAFDLSCHQPGTKGNSIQ
ncbi:MAG: dihydrolipoyl dehydrogenase [Oscillospiraceae bacterium]|jgi:dihydrolipoamide dehydrogenase|nr:dihydrolipoyl dehydrogenase [Oscillospiraceae bacterium]